MMSGHARLIGKTKISFSVKSKDSISRSMVVAWLAALDRGFSHVLGKCDFARR
jgi:hypothetical protein